MIMRHKVFVSYYHNENQFDREWFEMLFAEYFDVMVSKSVDKDDIDIKSNTETIRQKIRDEYIRDATVIVVLIGPHTWQRKHVDWEIYSGLRDTQYNSRCGLLGILLPTYPRLPEYKYNHRTIPPRLYDNIKCEYAEIYNWSEDPNNVSQWIHEAFQRRNQKPDPDLHRPMFSRNRTESSWQ